MIMTIKRWRIYPLLLCLISGCVAGPPATQPSSPRPANRPATAIIQETEPTPVDAPGKPPSVIITDQQLTDKALEQHIQQGLFHEDIAEVELPGNQLTSAGLQALLDTPIQSLQVLNLYNNQLGDAGAIMMGHSQKLAGLNRILVGNNEITLAGIEALLGPDSHIVGPTWIDVSGNPIGDAGARLILDRPNLEYLEGLSLRRTGLSDSGAAALAEAAAKMKNLQYLDVSGNDLTAAGREALTNSPALKNAKILFE